MGYDAYSGNFNGAIPDFYNYVAVTNGIADTITTYATTQTVTDAINWLDTLQSGKPFFMWLAFNAPHTPFHKPPDTLHTVPGLIGTVAHINNNPKLYFKAALEAVNAPEAIGPFCELCFQNRFRFVGHAPEIVDLTALIRSPVHGLPLK